MQSALLASNQAAGAQVAPPAHCRSRLLLDSWGGGARRSLILFDHLGVQPGAIRRRLGWRRRLRRWWSLVICHAVIVTAGTDRPAHRRGIDGSPTFRVMALRLVGLVTLKRSGIVAASSPTREDAQHG